MHRSFACLAVTIASVLYAGFACAQQTMTYPTTSTPWSDVEKYAFETRTTGQDGSLHSSPPMIAEGAFFAEREPEINPESRMQGHAPEDVRTWTVLKEGSSK